MNTDQRVALLASCNGTDWSTITRFERDFQELKDRRGYRQYPILQLPSGEGGGRVLATGQALAGSHGQLLAWSEQEIVRAISRSASGVEPHC